MKLLIAGSRNITDLSVVKKALKYSGIKPNQVTEIISGAARGVDEIGESIALEHCIPVKQFHANWENGKSAGILRNQSMGLYADQLVAIWDGFSKGTKHMIDYMKSLNKPAFVFNLREQEEW